MMMIIMMMVMMMIFLGDVFEYEMDAFWYLVMRGVSRFYSSHHRFPGSQDSDVIDDFGPLKVCFF
jgi:hypothetical protein